MYTKPVGVATGGGALAATGFATLPTATLAVVLILVGFALLRLGSVRRHDRRNGA